MVDKLSEFQEMLNAAYLEYVNKTKRRKASDNDFARWLDVSPASLNQWINGNRTPDLSNTIKLSRKMGVGVFDVLGYPRVIDTIQNPELKFIIDNWHLVNETTQTQILDHLHEVLGAEYDEFRIKEGNRKPGKD